jgi:cytochrome c556
MGVWFFHPPVENGEHHMIRAALAVASAAAIGLGAHIAAAQQDPIAARKALMKGNADQAKIGADMTKGEAPFDLAKVKKIFATFEDTAAKAPALFPEHSIDQRTADDPYTASPKIWENMDDFKARLAKFGSDAKAASASVKDLESFKKAFSVTSARMIAAAATKNTASSRADTF